VKVGLSAAILYVILIYHLQDRMIFVYNEIINFYIFFGRQNILHHSKLVKNISFGFFHNFHGIVYVSVCMSSNVVVEWLTLLLRIRED
jgi:hypothetical protein